MSRIFQSINYVYANPISPHIGDNNSAVYEILSIYNEDIEIAANDVIYTNLFLPILYSRNPKCLIILAAVSCTWGAQDFNNKCC